MANDVRLGVTLTGMAQVRTGLASLQAGMQRFAQANTATLGGMGKGLVTLQNGFRNYNQAVATTTQTLHRHTNAVTRAGIATNAAFSGRTMASVAGLASSIRLLNGSMVGLGATATSAFRTLTGFKAIVTATAGVGLGVWLVGLADKYTLLNAKIAIVTKSSEEQKRAMDAIFEIAQRTRVPIAAVGQTYQRLALSGSHLGMTQSQVAAITETLGKALQVSGATASEAAGGMIQLTQAMSKGKLDGDELRSVFENMPPVVRALEVSMGKTRGELYKMASQGKITAYELSTAILRARVEIDAQFALIPRTVGQALTQLSNEFFRVFGEITTGNQSMRGLVASMDELRKVVASPEFASGLATILKFFTDTTIAAANFIASIDIAAIRLKGFSEKLKVVMSDPIVGNWGDRFRLIDFHTRQAIASLEKMKAETKEVVSTLGGMSLGAALVNQISIGFDAAAMSAEEAADKFKEFWSVYSGITGGGGGGDSGGGSKIQSMSEQMRSWVDHAIASGTASERFATGASILQQRLDAGIITLARYNELMRELRTQTDMMNFGDRAAAEAKSAVDAYQSIIPPLQLYAATLAEIRARQIETGMAGAEVAKLQGMAFSELAHTTLGAAGAMTGALSQMFEGNKAFAIANVVVHTAEAIAAALKNPPGPPFSYVYAAAAAATGAAQIAAIQSASPGSATAPSVGGGATGGASGGASGGGGRGRISGTRGAGKDRGRIISGEDGSEFIPPGGGPVFVMNFEREFISDDNNLGAFARKTSDRFSKEYKRRFGKRPF